MRRLGSLRTQDKEKAEADSSAGSSIVSNRTTTGRVASRITTLTRSGAHTRSRTDRQFAARRPVSVEGASHGDAVSGSAATAEPFDVLRLKMDSPAGCVTAI